MMTDKKIQAAFRSFTVEDWQLVFEIVMLLHASLERLAAK